MAFLNSFLRRNAFCIAVRSFVLPCLLFCSFSDRCLGGEVVEVTKAGGRVGISHTADHRWKSKDQVCILRNGDQILGCGVVVKTLRTKAIVKLLLHITKPAVGDEARWVLLPENFPALEGAGVIKKKKESSSLAKKKTKKKTSKKKKRKKKRKRKKRKTKEKDLELWQ